MDKKTRWGRKFRRKFRLPPSLVNAIVARLVELGFSDAEEYRGRQLPPLILKVLGVLRVLGRGVTFDDVEEVNWVSEETNRAFFHKCCHAIGVQMWDEHIRFPKTTADVQRCVATFEGTGFPGCAFSTDCTHIHWGCTPFGLKVAHTGKEGFPTLSYSVSSRSVMG